MRSFFEADPKLRQPHMLQEGTPVVPFCPVYFWVSLFQLNSRKLGNLDKFVPLLSEPQFNLANLYLQSQRMDEARVLYGLRLKPQPWDPYKYNYYIPYMYPSGSLEPPLKKILMCLLYPICTLQGPQNPPKRPKVPS